MSPRPRRMSETVEQTISPSVTVVQEAMARLGLRQVHLATMVGLTKDHLSRILLGKVAFPRNRDTLRAFADALKLEPFIFREYREQLQVLPESTRRLVAHLRTRGMSEQMFVERVQGYSAAYVQVLLRGGAPFPKEPEAIERLAAAADCSPFVFDEYVPLATWRPRLSKLASDCLPEALQRHFADALDQMHAHVRALIQAEPSFEAQLLRDWLARQFDSLQASGDPVFVDALAYLPPLSSYQPVVRVVLRKLYHSGLDVEQLAMATDTDPSELYAIANGQITLQPGPLQDQLLQYLQITPDEIEHEQEGRT